MTSLIDAISNRNEKEKKMKELNLNGCVKYEFKDLEICLDCNGFGILSKRKICKDYEPKTEYLEDYLGEENE